MFYSAILFFSKDLFSTINYRLINKGVSRKMFKVFERYDVRLLEGAIDLHVHPAPDLLARSLDAIELAEQAAAVGMRAIVFKCHFFPTVFMAYFARKAVESNVDVFGGIVLNHYVGGFNPHAVEASIKAGGKIVWMPTISAANHIHYYKGLKSKEWGLKGLELKSRGIGLSPINKKDEITPSVEEILGIIADTNRVLATGHLSVHEIEVLVEEAKSVGVRKILINHPAFRVVNMPIGKQKELAKKGAYIEHVFLLLTPMWYTMSPGDMVKMIKDVGIEHSIIATDLGQIHNPSPIEGLRVFIQILLENGLRPHEVKSLVVKNPANLLGIKIRKSEN